MWSGLLLLACALSLLAVFVSPPIPTLQIFDAKFLTKPGLDYRNPSKIGDSLNAARKHGVLFTFHLIFDELQSFALTRIEKRIIVASMGLKGKDR